MQQTVASQAFEIATFKDDFDTEREDFLKLSAYGLSRAYSDDEPEYTLDDCIELNPNILINN